MSPFFKRILTHVLSVSLVTLCLFAHAAHADKAPVALSTPTGPVVLTITGKIQNTNVPGQADFDLAMLYDLPSSRIVTRTPWTQGIHTFDGVSIQVLMDAVATKGMTAEFTALNDYTVRFDLNDAIKHHAIIAYLKNSLPLRVRDKGPLWIIFPMDDDPTLQTTTYRDRMVWQLRTIKVK